MLRRAEVGETPPDDGVVEPGMVVTYQFVGDDDDRDVPARRPRDRAEDVDGLEVFSPQSPLGSAILGDARATPSTLHQRPNGKELKVEIVDAVPYTGLTRSRDRVTR